MHPQLHFIIRGLSVKEQQDLTMPPYSRLQQRMRPLPVWSYESSSDSESKESSVEFGSVEIREYCRELGPYLYLENGLAIGWEYQQHRPISLNEYEKEEQQSKELKKKSSERGGFKRAFKKLGGSSEEETAKDSGIYNPTTPKERKKILETFGYSKQELDRVERARLQKLGYSRPSQIIRKAQRACALKGRGSG